ncbi:hypothetical protein A6R68_12397 [Neotoma lepida]|uniref:Nucleoplasmin core domain-containing protein n=1 Tax=Neotoma lepida TaxID=56216 RepID=A0A1A6H5A3_NEOLE|nr:hypothetical protein A6R68_12397 [Neotoma lepida]
MERHLTEKGEALGKIKVTAFFHHPSQISLGEKAREEVNRVEILPPANQEDKKLPVTIASLKPSVLPMSLENTNKPNILSNSVMFKPFTASHQDIVVTFRLRAGSGPVFLSGHECYETSDLPWEDEEEEEEDGEEEEEEEEDEDEDEDAEISLEETPIKQVKRVAPQKQMSLAKAQPSGQESQEEVDTITTNSKSLAVSSTHLSPLTREPT